MSAAQRAAETVAWTAGINPAGMRLVRVGENVILLLPAAQAIAYLITAMEMHGQQLGLGCGELVDAAVHAFILDTQNYREFCHRYFNGKFLEHIPEIERKCDGSVQRTAEVIDANGFWVDWPLWEKDFSKCTPCYPGSDCH